MYPFMLGGKVNSPALHNTILVYVLFYASRRVTDLGIIIKFDKMVGTLPCCALGAQIPPPLIFDFFLSNSSPCREL